MNNISQEQIRKIGCILMGATAVYTLPWTRGLLSFLDMKLFGTITLLHVIAIASIYFVYRVYYRNL